MIRIEDMVEVTLNEKDDFLKIRETLTRIGVASKKEKLLYQSCHILHKQGKYYIVHFKELFALDGKPTDITENDLARRNTIALLLEDWGLLKLVDSKKAEDLQVSLSHSLLTRLTKETYMTLTSLFPSRSVYEPFTVGFDKLFDQLQDTANNIAKNAPNWPPYNIKKVKDNKYVIEMAVAGFAKSDIEVTVEGNKLVIKGESNDNEAENYIFKGIANRAFQRTFTIADKVEIKDAEMVNGMLRVWLENLYQTQETVKKIAIKEADSK